MEPNSEIEQKLEKLEKKKGYLGWAWSGIKYYTQTSYYLAFVYGKMRSLMQPYISTEFNIQEVEQGVFIGDIASAFNVDELKRLGVTHVVTAVLGVAPQFPKDFVYMTVPIRDVESEDIKTHLPKTTQFIDDAVASGGKVLVHCLSEEMQILTNYGFMYLCDIEKHYDSDLNLRADSNLLIGSYDEKTESLQYVKSDKLIINEAQPQTMIDFTQRQDAENWGLERKENIHESRSSSHISMVVTPQHDMYVCPGKYGQRKDRVDGQCYFNRKQDGKQLPQKFSKIKAQDLLIETPTESQLLQGFQLMCNTKIGLLESAEYTIDSCPEYVTSLELKTQEEIDAFLELYGYWLGDGSLQFKQKQGGIDSLTFQPVKQLDKTYIENLFQRLGFIEGKHWCTYDTNMKNSAALQANEDRIRKRKIYYLFDSKWSTYFRSHYQEKYSAWENALIHVKSHPLAPTKETIVKIKSGKWFAPWVFKTKKRELDLILKGYRIADGCEGGKQNHIWTSSILMRDQLIQIGLHAGHSVSFSLEYKAGTHRGLNTYGKDIIAKHDSWRVHWGNTSSAKPTMSKTLDVQRVHYNGRTWCVSVPSGLIITRRAKKDDDGNIIKASRPTIIGNCVCGVSRSATIVAAWVMSKHGYSVEETLQILKTRRECVDPNPAFRDQLEQYSKTEYQ